MSSVNYVKYQLWKYQSWYDSDSQAQLCQFQLCKYQLCARPFASHVCYIAIPYIATKLYVANKKCVTTIGVLGTKYSGNIWTSLASIFIWPCSTLDLGFLFHKLKIWLYSITFVKGKILYFILPSFLKTWCAKW